MSDPAPHSAPAPATPDPHATLPAGAAATPPPSPEQVWTNDVFTSLSSTPVSVAEVGNAQNAVRRAIDKLTTFNILDAASFNYAPGEIASFPDTVLDLEPQIVQRVANTRRNILGVFGRNFIAARSVKYLLLMPFIHARVEAGKIFPLDEATERFQKESVGNFLRRRAFEEAQNETRLSRKLPIVKGVLRWYRKRNLSQQYQGRIHIPPQDRNIIYEARLRSRKQVHHGHEYNYNHLEGRLNVEQSHGEPIRAALDRVLTPGQRSPDNGHYRALARLLTADPAARASFGRVYPRIHHGDERKPELERNLKNTQDRIAALDGLTSSYDTLLTEQGKLQDFDREMVRLDDEMTFIQGQITTLSAGIGGITNRRRITELRQELAQRRQERENMRQQWRQSYQLFMDTRVKMSSFARQLPDEPILNFDPTAGVAIAAPAPFLTPSVFVQRVLLRHPLNNPTPPPAFVAGAPPLPVDDAVVTQSLSSLKGLKNDRTGWTGWQTEERHLKQELDHLEHAPASAHHKVSAEQLLYLVLEDRLEHGTPHITDPYTVKLAVNMAFVDANTNMYRNANRELARDFLRGRATRFLDNRRGLSFQDVLERLATMEEYKDLRKLVRSPRRKPITINDVRGLRIDRDLLMNLSSMLEQTLESFPHQQESGKQSKVKLRDQDALHLQNLISLIQQVWAERDAQSFRDSSNPANRAKLEEQFPELKNVSRGEDFIINLLQSQSTHREKRREAIQKLYPARPEWKSFLDKRDYAERMKESREHAASLSGPDRQQFLKDLGVTDLAYSVPFLMNAGDWWKKWKFDKEARKAREKAEQELTGETAGSRMKRHIKDKLTAPFRAYGKLVKFFWSDIPKAVTKPFRPVTDRTVDSGIDLGKYIFSKRFFPIALASWILRAPLVVGLSSDDRKKYLQGRKAEAEEGKAEREKAREARREKRAARRAPKAEKPKAVRRRRAEAAAPSAPAQAPAQPAAPAATHAPSVAAPTAPTTAPATPAPTQAATHTAPPTGH